MKYNFDRIPNRRNPDILNKWIWYPDDIIPMWVADADFQVASQIQKALQRQIRHGVLGYELLPNKALGAFSQFTVENRTR